MAVRIADVAMPADPRDYPASQDIFADVHDDHQDTHSSSSSSVENASAKVPMSQEGRSVLVTTDVLRKGETIVTLIEKEFESGAIDIAQDCIIRVRTRIEQLNIKPNALSSFPTMS